MNYRGDSRYLSVACIALLIGALAGCDNPPRNADLNWVEPVELDSGETVKVSRHVTMWHEGAFGGGAGSAPVYELSSLELSPHSPDFPAWEAPLVPVVMDKDPLSGDWIVVASIDGCSLWERNGRPRPPYWAFQLQERIWYRVEIPQSFVGRTANLLVEYDVTDSSQLLNSEIEKRKDSQSFEAKHARQ